MNIKNARESLRPLVVSSAPTMTSVFSSQNYQGLTLFPYEVNH